MADGFLKRGMNYLGLVHDDYDEDGDLVPGDGEYSEAPDASRQLGDEEGESPRGSVQTFTPPRLQPSSNVSVITPRTVRSRSSEPCPDVRAVAPTQFADGTQIADCLKANRSVIVNLQVAERALKRRMIDFCSGVAYALRGDMERVADDVFLITPSDVELSADEHQPWQQLA